MQALLSSNPLGLGGEGLGGEHMSYAAQLDPELADALVSMKGGRAKIHEVKKQHGFFKGWTDGMFTPTGTT